MNDQDLSDLSPHTRRPSDTHGRIKMATVATEDLASTLNFYQQQFDYRVVSSGSADAWLATAWGAPSQEGSSYAVLGPSSGVPVYLRLIETPRPQDSQPRRSLGWAALELTVKDVDSLHTQLKENGLNILGTPALLEFTDKIYPMQVEGPAGEVIYLNEVRGNLENLDLPRAQCDVDHLFIVILAAPNLETATDYYVRQLGFEGGGAFELPYKMINQAFALPSHRRHRLTTTQVGRLVNVEIDQYPEMAHERRQIDGYLPPAIASVSFIVDSLDALEATFLTAPVNRPELPYEGRRVATSVGTAGELIEFIEACD